MSCQELLIVNADDWGGFRAGTDAIELCFVAGAISSTTAMVHMADSRRAAELARERGRSTGLHLNLTQPFDASDVPASVRERQRRLCARFANLRLRRWLWSPDPRARALVTDGIRDQIERYRECYGAEPTHVDSHHHVHVCPDVLFSKALESGTRVRQTLSPAPSTARDLASVGRRAKHELLAHRFVTTTHFWRARELVGGYGAVPIAQAAALARERSVEVMVHPSLQNELETLRAGAWLEALAGARLGSYSALLP